MTYALRALLDAQQTARLGEIAPAALGVTVDLPAKRINGGTLTHAQGWAHGGDKAGRDHDRG